MNVGPQGLLVVRLPAPLVSHSSSFGPPMAMQASAPAARLRTSYRSGCMFLFYLLGVGLPCVRFSVSSGCGRRRSVSTYAAPLVLLILIFQWYFQHVFYFSQLMKLGLWSLHIYRHLKGGLLSSCNNNRPHVNHFPSVVVGM